MIREKQVEAYLRKAVEVYEGRAYKWVSPGNNGVPDRIVVLPPHPELPVRLWGVTFIEVKAPSGRLTALQRAKLIELRKLGCSAGWINSYEDVDAFIEDGIILAP